MVNLTRIYTRTGDAGRTRLGDMSETSKTDLRLEAYACVDEGNAHIGVALAHGGLEDDVGRPPPRRAPRRTPCGAGGGGGGGGAGGPHERPRDPLPQPPLGPALHP